jgi:hypothetical protein
MFGARNKAQSFACKVFLDSQDAAIGEPLSIVQFYQLLCLSYCVGIEAFQSVLTNDSAKRFLNRVVSSTIQRDATNGFSNVESVKRPSDIGFGVGARKSNRRMRIALCVSGQLRGFKHFHTSFAMLQLDRHDCEIFVSTWEKVGGRFPHLGQASRIFPSSFSLKFRESLLSLGEAGFLMRYPSIAKLVNNPTRVSLSELKDFYKTDHIDLQNDDVDPFLKMPTIAKMHYKLGRCHDLVINSNRKFDLLIRMRPDLRFTQPVALDWEELYFSSLKRRSIFSDFGTCISTRIINWQIGPIVPLMIGDLFAVGQFDVMRPYMRSFDENIQLLGQDIVGLPAGFMPHTTLSRILMYHGVGVETLPGSSISGENLVEFSAVSKVEIFEALSRDMRGRSYDEHDALLFSGLLDVE